MEDEYSGYKGRNLYCKDQKESWLDTFEYILTVSTPIGTIYKKWVTFECAINHKAIDINNHRVQNPKFLQDTNINFSWLLQYREMPKKREWKICVICGGLHFDKEPFCSATCSIYYCEQNGIWYQRVKLKGYSSLYCKKFNNDLKTRVRAFFNYTCVLCGKPEEESGQKLSVHHVNYDKHVCCNDNPVRFVALCKSCHMKTNGNRKYWENLFETELREKYNYKCYYTKKEFHQLKTMENNKSIDISKDFQNTTVYS